MASSSLPSAAGPYHLTVEANGRTIDVAQPSTSSRRALSRPHLSVRGELNIALLKGQAATGGEELSSEAVSELPSTSAISARCCCSRRTMTDANGATNFTAQFAINGQRGVEATFAMDGADISDPEMGGSTFSNFNVDAVEGIDSSSGWMPAEIGRGAAGFTNIHTRSGASGFHGRFEFVRNSAFDAATISITLHRLSSRIPPFRRNEFGFTNGGPIYIPHLYDGRKGSYYFFQYQGFRQVLGTTQVMPVPTSSEHAGIDPVTYADGSTDTLNVPVDAPSPLFWLVIPSQTTLRPVCRTHLRTASKVATDADQFSIRLDHKLSTKDQFSPASTSITLPVPPPIRPDRRRSILWNPVH